jgi:uncharacterized protein with GYD domain
VTHPQDRSEAVRKPIENLSGKVIGFWLSFGEYDVMSIVKMPDNVSAAAISPALAGGGSMKKQKTSPLLTVEDGLAALNKAAGCGYTAIAAKIVAGPRESTQFDDRTGGALG